MHLIIAVGAASVIATAQCIFSGEVRGSEQAIGYAHGETSCLQGNEGPGTRLRLSQHNRCEGNVSYPYLEIDIRELPVTLRKSITIGADNWAFRCVDPKESCEQSQGGNIVFDHFEGNAGKKIRTDGSYELRFRTGTESGHFEVDCQAPCG